MQAHFFNEETLLFDKIDAVVCRRAKLDHQLITSQIAHLNAAGKSDYKAYQQLNDRLNAHIRYEERVVFPYLERTLSTALATYLMPLEEANKDGDIDEFPDEFWKHNG